MGALPIPMRPRPEPGVTVHVVNVTPAIAEGWLRRNVHNRNQRPALVNLYCRDMTEGRWQLTGEGIKFAANGTLLDGQHRLAAVVKSGVTVRMVVIENLPPEAQDVMDTGARRTPADALGLNGYANAKNLAATARLVRAWGEGLLRDPGHSTNNSWAKYTNSEIHEFITQNPDLEDAVVRSLAIRRNLDVSPSVAAACWWWFGRINEDAAAEFFRSWAENDTGGPGDPIHTLIKRTGNARRAGEVLRTRPQLYLVVRTWNAWRIGEALTVLRGVRDGGPRLPDPV